MSNLLASLISSARALNVFDQALVVAQNNVVNAATPGYAAQRLKPVASAFEPNLGLIGGVQAGELESARNLFAEQAVRRQLESLGYFEQSAQSLTSVESVFDVTGLSGIPGSLNALLESFSAWSVDPNSTEARQSVLDNAQKVADAFRHAAITLDQTSSDTDLQLRQLVDKVNQLGEELLAANAEIRRGANRDAGLDTRIHNNLEELSELVNITVLHQTDGSITVLIGGQTPLVVGDHLYRIRPNFDLPADPPPTYPEAQAPARILSSDGTDITSQIALGKLAGLLYVRNEVLPSLVGDAYHEGDLNRLAKAMADRINELLTSGLTATGDPPETGLPLFTYSAANPARAAQTLSVNPDITTDKLAAIDPGPPFVSNGIALRLANLANSTDPADGVDGFSYIEFYGRVAGRVGRLLADAKDAKDFKTQMVTQARSLRQELSGVSLDEEAMRILEFQRAYQANAKVINLLDELTEVTISLLR